MASAPPGGLFHVKRRRGRAPSRHRRVPWERMRPRRPTVIGVLNAVGLGAFSIAGGMLSPIVGVAIFGAACLVYAWLVDDGR